MMTAAILFTLAAILALLLFSAFFSGSETALTAASRSRLHQLAERGDRGARQAVRLIERRELLIGAILLGNNAVNILASALATSLTIGLFGEPGVAYATVAMTALVYLFAEVLPKTWAIRHADRAALAVAPALRAPVAVLAPVSRSASVLADWIIGLAGRPAAGALSTADELRGLFDLRAREGLVRKDYRDMLRSILDLADVEVGEIMTHRKNMTAADADLPAAELASFVLASPFTRVPLWRGDPDNIVGVLHAKALLQALRGGGGGGAGEADVVALAHEPIFVPDTTSLAEQLAAFRARREHFALVVDEYGALQGLVTLEDILEEIVGDISDEYDRPASGIRRQSDGSFVVDGEVTIRDLNRALDTRLPDEEAATAAGLVLDLAETIPQIGETYAIDGHVFEVVGREDNRIARLRLTRRKPEG